ncbi:MAG TPA: hypothetical protein VF157_01970 [Chloroflexota bacterium]
MEQATVPTLIAVGVALIAWYLVGNELMRRRARRLAVWCKRAADLIGSKQSIKWFTMHSFRLDVENPASPFRGASFTGLTESWDVPLIWLWNRIHWRRDMVLVQLTLEAQPMWGLELFRPRSVLAGDAGHAARDEGWDQAPLAGFRVAPAEGPGGELAQQLLERLDSQRQHLIRLSVRRKDAQLSLALNVPSVETLAPEELFQLLRGLAADLSLQRA